MTVFKHEIELHKRRIDQLEVQMNQVLEEIKKLSVKSAENYTGDEMVISAEQLENWLNDLSLHGVGDIETAEEIKQLLETQNN